MNIKVGHSNNISFMYSINKPFIIIIIILKNSSEIIYMKTAQIQRPAEIIS
jgi:hypothetical protein